MKLANKSVKEKNLRESNLFYNQEGFTLMEVMLTLFIIGMIFILISSGLFQGRVLRPIVENQQQVKWHLFLNQWETYLQEAKFEKITSKQLITKEFSSGSKERETFIYKKSGNAFIRTKLAGGGYQPLVLEVRNVELTKKEEQIEICIYFTDGTYQIGKVPIKHLEE